MPLTTVNLRPQDSSHIVIDWSQALSEKAEAEIEKMIAWVKNYPQKKDIHVYLGSARHCAPGRKLQNALQALGCTVTNRNVFCSA